MPSRASNVKDEKQDETRKQKGMSNSRAAPIAHSPEPSSRGGESSSGSSPTQGGTTSPRRAGGRKGGEATSSKR
jgi:hypothetical protein